MPDPQNSENCQSIDALIIGAGLSGLSCATRLHEAGRSVVILEASDKIGGRVQTDEVDSFKLDRGFQVFLDAYPEASRFLDLESLDLRPFEPGALVWKRGQLRKVMDVFRRPGSLLSSGLSPIGSLKDKLLVAKLRYQLLRKPVKAIWSSPEMTTRQYLEEFGFSERMIYDFFRGFYGGIFLEDSLTTSSRIFEFTFKMFAQGSATLPAAGMKAIPEQLASRLPENAIRFGEAVEMIEGMTVSTHKSEYTARHLMVATDGENASRLIPGTTETQWNSTVCYYFRARKSPLNSPIIALKGDREGIINNLCVPSDVNPTYAPHGESLICLSLLGEPTIDAQLDQQVQSELIEWFGETAVEWKLLKREVIRKALPIDPPGHFPEPREIGPVYRIGDFTTSGSIEGAIISGLRAADQILAKPQGRRSTPPSHATIKSSHSFRSATN